MQLIASLHHEQSYHRLFNMCIGYKMSTLAATQDKCVYRKEANE